MNKIVVVVSGGVVNSVYADCDVQNVQIVDFDNLKAQGKSEEEEDEFFHNAVDKLFRVL